MRKSLQLPKLLILFLILLFFLGNQTFIYPQKINRVFLYNSLDDLSQQENSITSNASALETDNESNYLSNWYNVFLHTPLNIFDFSKDLINKNSIEPLGIIVGTTSLGLFFDRKDWQNTKILTRRSHILPGLTKDIVNVGDGRWQLSAAGLGILSGLIFHNQRVENTSFESIEAIISTGLFVQVAKRITGRQSPAEAGMSSNIWEMFVDPVEYQHNQPNFYSFPSGHLAGATAVLTVITENYPEIKWLKPVSYILLSALAFSLVANDMHWYSDFPVALGTGYLFGKIISGRYPIRKSLNENKVSVEPMVYQNRIGVFLSYSL